MNLKPRIYISAPVDKNLSSGQLKLKQSILHLLQTDGLDPQEFHVSGLAANQSWSFERSIDVMRRCHGALILAFSQWHDTSRTPPVVMPTEYNHFEGALGISLQKEILIIKDEAVAFRGITNSGGGEFILSIPNTPTPAWLKSNEFQKQYSGWKDRIQRRHHVFFGYCGGATDTANRIIRYLQSIDVTVRDWQMDFRPAGTILDEIEEASRMCIGGIFLFSKDDELISGDAVHASPRDNVVFEAGFFMHAMGRQRCLIIREGGAKMPADVGGGIYLSLPDRTNTSTIETALRRFIETRI
ncbi:MAG: nucleotide-binding protein [Planctomycetaceae bacterium]|jgi:hypothetical protein|nr:nucleotide-binding protein [Planctomycetaceae bacterium]MCE2811815.1 nucleotide-binding protein [Planctomycetaceae bacterium]